MKNFLLLFSLFALSLNTQAQGETDDWMHTEGHYEGFQAGSVWLTLVTDANLRESPNTASNVLAKLPIATPVTIVEANTDSLELRGVKMPWLKVTCQTGGKAYTGYIWGGFMALAHINTPSGYPQEGTTYLIGVGAYNPDKHTITLQVRTALNNRELSKTEFSTQGDLSYYPAFSISYDPLKNVKAVLKINYYFPACGYPSGDNLVFWLENNQLLKVLETSSISEAGLFYSSEEYILPGDKGGIGEHVIVTKDESEFDENSDELLRTKQQIAVTVYKWNGQKLTKLKI
jgi:hypothetical protein